MDQDWGDDWGGDDGDYHGDAAETANLGDPDEPLASGIGGYGDHDAGYPGEGGDYSAGDPGDPGSQPGGGFLEDDPMGAFGGGDDPDSGPDADLGAGEPGVDDPDGDAFGPDAGPHDGTDDGADPGSGDPDPIAYEGTDSDTSADPESVVGADPDVDPDADWSPEDFPVQLDFAAPEPVDGYPWSDPSAVAAPGTGGDDPSAAPDGAPPAQDLLDYAGAEGGADPWSALVGSDDPATSSLGRWWSPSA
jgi:hypothetical protein